MQLADGEAGQAAIIKQNEADGVKVMTWSNEFLTAFRKEWANVIAEETKANPDSKRVWDSLQAFRKEYAVWGDRAYLKPAQ
jgi:TRAP-type mannitol/chloroaromatic compound transport system substrate-binding protein